MYIDWVSVATISTRQDIKSFPAVTLVSYTDGLLGNGSGIPYLYLTPLDFTAQDLTVSITVTEQNLSSLYVFSSMLFLISSIDKIVNNIDFFLLIKILIKTYYSI